MKLSVKNIKKMDNNEIYEQIISVIDNIYKEFGYAYFSKKDYYELVIKEILASKQEYNGEMDYLKYMEYKIHIKIRIILSNEVNDLLSDEDKIFNILDNYINQNFTKTNNYNKSISYLKKLTKFLVT